MELARQHMRRFAWIALLAMLALALLPSVSRALDTGGESGPWAQICSAPGDAGSPALPGTPGHADHCPLCTHGAGPLGLSPTAVAVLGAPGPCEHAEPAAGLAAVAAVGWRIAQPRAPPALS